VRAQGRACMPRTGAQRCSQSVEKAWPGASVTQGVGRRPHDVSIPAASYLARAHAPVPATLARAAGLRKPWQAGQGALGARAVRTVLIG